jgi:hypothetical protein
MWRKVGIAQQGAQRGVEMSLGPHPSFQLALRRVLPMAVAPDHTLVGGVMVLRMGAPVLCHARIPHSEELRTDPQGYRYRWCISTDPHAALPVLSLSFSPRSFLPLPSELLDPMRATCWRKVRLQLGVEYRKVRLQLGVK